MIQWLKLQHRSIIYVVRLSASYAISLILHFRQISLLETGSLKSGNDNGIYRQNKSQSIISIEKPFASASVSLPAFESAPRKEIKDSMGSEPA